ncbi:MAG TPA: M55 family metallopeptidase, partial [Myxococcaceae bacterium]|nr:M55 family metallopeptidase [Myxococcaceae bacterium]
GAGRVLLVVDLEGVAGVDSVEALVAGAPGYERARELLTAEVAAAVEGLLAAGSARVRVSDSHLAGTGEPNLLAGALPPEAEPCFFPEDAYAAHLFEGVEAVACLGMHAAAGSAGFGAHTVDVLGAWACGGRTLSEADLVLALAAEAGLPALFISGDDVLRDSLGGRVGYVCTKQALSPGRASSRAPEEVRTELARAAALPGRRVEPLPGVPLVLAFKSRRQAALAVEAGARRVDDYRVEVEGRTFRERYSRALEAAAAASQVLGDVVRDEPGSPAFTRDVTSLLLLSGPPARPSSRAREAERALGAFLSLTEGTSAEARALRALTLHMLESHAPRAFARWGLGPVLEAAVEALSSVPVALEPGLPPDEAQDRVDAWFVRRERGLPHPELAPAALRAYLEHLDEEGYGLYAWLLGEMAASCGVDVRLSIPERALRELSRLVELYWLTHLYLLDTRYLRAPLRDGRAAAWTEELLVATPWLLSEGHVDLAAEVAFCLQCAGEAGGGAHEALLSFLAAHQQADGRLSDETLDASAEESAAHATAAALLAFAGADER